MIRLRNQTGIGAYGGRWRKSYDLTSLIKKFDSGSWLRTSVSCFESYKILGGRSKMKQVTDDKSMFFVTFVLKNLYVERSFP